MNVAELSQMFAAVAEERRNTLKRVLDVIAEYEATATTDAYDERLSDGEDYDPNSYGAGFNTGVIQAAKQIKQAIEALED